MRMTDDSSKWCAGPCAERQVLGARCIVSSGCVEVCDDPGDLEAPWPDVDEKHHEPRRLPLWFRGACFSYTAVGIDMVLRMRVLECLHSDFIWRTEASLLLLQGLLAFLHDAHFQGRCHQAKVADRSCATFLTFCQPIKFATCTMDWVQLTLLALFWALGLACFIIGRRAWSAGGHIRYEMFHTLWHILLPLGGFLWIEYTARTGFALTALASGTSALATADCVALFAKPQARSPTFIPI